MNLKSLHRYDWIALLDVDEVIVPRKHTSWAKMMEEVEEHMSSQPIISPYLMSPFISSYNPQGWTWRIGVLQLVFHQHHL